MSPPLHDHPFSGNHGPVLQPMPAAVAVAYFAVYLLLEWVSFIHPVQGLNITPWNPQSAVAVAMLLYRPASWWLVAAAAVVGEWLVGLQPLAWPLALGSAAAYSAGFILIAAVLRRRLGRRLQLDTRADFAAFLFLVVAGALATAVLQALAIVAATAQTADRAVIAIHRRWIADAAGLLVTLPLLALLLAREGRVQLLAVARSLEWWAIAAAATVAALFVFGRPAQEQFKFFYLLFVPVAWSAGRFGVAGAVSASALVQLLLVAAVQAVPYRPLTVFELQLLMAALAATGLLLGVTVDEREATGRRLRESLRAAAAGDMAAALAHELNQPLAALSTYARAMQLLAERGDREQGKLVDVASRVVQEAGRAADVVRRLRDFFRDHSVAMRETSVQDLVVELVDSQRERARELDVRLDCRCDPSLPTLWLDRVQVAVVLRNLLSNALDAVAAASCSAREVRVHAGVEEADVVVSVYDTGTGLRPEDLDAVFESRGSAKPGGMGIGLGISRSIVEAHGGRLWAEPGPGGRFHVSFPISNPLP